VNSSRQAFRAQPTASLPLAPLVRSSRSQAPLGNASREAPLRVNSAGERSQIDSKQSFSTRVPKQSLGTRNSGTRNSGAQAEKLRFASIALLAIAPLIAGLGGATLCRAAEQDAGTPYKLTIVLDVAKNRVLTEVFRQQVERELREGLQAALGNLATVDVVREHPKLAEARKDGLKRSLDTWKECSDTKTHFVLIDLVNNQYEIRARQHDGPTGQASPVVRSDRTPDRAFVARAAALLIEQDLGFTATFHKWPEGESELVQPRNVQLDLLGAGLGVPLSRWVKPGDVFSVVQMLNDGRPPIPVVDALVQIQDAPQDNAPDTACVGKLFWRNRSPSEDGRVAGYRCVKLGAISAPVQLRVLQQKSDKAATPLQAAIEVRRSSFKGEEGSVVKGGSDPVFGIFTTAPRTDVRPYDRVAFVTISSGGRVRAYLPLPLVDDQTVTVAVSVNSEQVDALAERFDAWQRDVDDAWRVQVGIFEDLKELTLKASTPREKIVARAQAGLKRTSDDYERLALEKQQLLRDNSARQNDMVRLDTLMRELNKGIKVLTEFAGSQEKIVKDESRPERKAAQSQLADAGLAEERADYDRAIELYRKALAVIDEPRQKTHLEKLEREWMPRDDEHIRARKFIYETWPNLDTAGLDREMDAARKALQEFKTAGDYRSPRKLMLANNSHLARVQKEVADLKPAINEDDFKPAERIKKVIEQLRQLQSDALDFLKTASKDE
jgi:tetratricopeptide (TPR) repeat protein